MSSSTMRFRAVPAAFANVGRFCFASFVLLGCCFGLARAAERVALPGHVLTALAQATPTKSVALSPPMALTIVLRRSDPAGFDRYLAELYDPSSPEFRRYKSARQVSDLFGPSTADYAAVRGYFTGNGFSVIEDSANRMTLTVLGSREAIQQSLAVDIANYTAAAPDGSVREFFANADEPKLPADIAAKVHSIAGLSNLALPQRPTTVRQDNLIRVFPNNDAIVVATCTVSSYLSLYLNEAGRIKICNDCAAPKMSSKSNTTPCGKPPAGQLLGERGLAVDIGRMPANLAASKAIAGSSPNWLDLDGAGQHIGLLEFDRFDVADVVDYFELLGLPPTLIGQLAQVHVAGGAPAGASQSEVLLDIDFVMPIAPGANVTVYDAPFSGGGSFQSLFNRMIDDGMTIISNSWSYCEDQTTAADVAGIDAIFATAAASGISIFNAAGDLGSTCLDGSPNTVGVPAGAPHAIAVGGSSQASVDGAPFIYASETWWNGSASTPSTGSGGFGVSRFFSRPGYQDGFTSATNRSVPDIVTEADPRNGMVICQASAGGCPSPLVYGGTSMAAPALAAYTAILNQAQGTDLGFLNPLIYPLSASPAFHSPASMGSDFAHVGLGSPNVNALHVALAGLVLGPASATASDAFVENREPPSDGVTPSFVIVTLRDANGNTLGGKTVSLSANAGNHATITPASVVSNAANGAAVFTITDGTIETLTLIAHDTSDGVDIPVIEMIDVVSPPAAAGGILAFPTSVPPDAVTPTTITVTLHDALGQPSPGKRITLSQDGRSVVVGPDPPVTDAGGQIAFTATDGIEEIVTYTAVDETDGALPVPGTAVVTFTGAAAGSCVVPPSPADGYTLTSFANGFAAYPFFYGNVNWGCAGASDPAFDAEGNAYVVHFPTGALYKFGANGGSAVAPLATGLGPTLGKPAFGRDGRLYATHGATTGDFFTGDVVELDPVTGAQLRVLASNLTCPGALATDPLSGDLFFDDICYGAGSDNASLFRLTDPGDTDPDRPTEVVTYATLPATPNGKVAFAPDGTIYVNVGYLNPQPAIVSVTGTDQPQPAIITTVPDIWSFYWVNVGATLPDGGARSLIVLQSGAVGTDLNLIDITTDPVQTTTLAHDIGAGTIGADGCLYTATADTVYRIAPASGPCDFATTNPSPTLVLTPRNVTPDPTQGSVQTLTVTFDNIVVPADTTVLLQVNGANTQSQLLRTDANGVATFAYRGRFAGDDVVTAYAYTDVAMLTSNVARVTWLAGPHESFVNLSGVSGAIANQPVMLSASLLDIAVDPQAAIAGATMSFSVGGESCSGTTNASGVASCSVTLAHSGAYTLVVSYAGSAQHLAASANTLLVVPTDGVDLIFADGFDGD